MTDSYNPYDDLDDAPATAAASSEGEAEAYNPYSELDDVGRGVPFNGTIEGELIPGTIEFDLATTSPSGYATMRTLTDFVPFVNYGVWPSERDKFMKLDQEDQTSALLWESFGTAIWAALLPAKAGSGLMRLGVKEGQSLFGAGVKGVYKQTAGRLASRFKAKPAEILPIEDAIKGIRGLAPDTPIAEFSYHDKLRKVLKREGFRKEEIEDILPLMETGEEFPLNTIIRNIKETRWGKGPPSKAFQAATEKLPTEMRPRLGLKAEFRAEFSDSVLRGKHYHAEFERQLRKEVLGKGAVEKGQRTLKGSVVDAVFGSMRNKVYPEIGQAGFGDMTHEMMVNLSHNMLSGKRAAGASLMLAAGRFGPAALHPARVVFGLGEQAFGSFTRIYTPVKRALGLANKDYFNHTMLWAKMLEDVGLYAKVTVRETGEFVIKRAEHFTKAVEETAGLAARQMDDLMGAARRLEGETGAAFVAAREEMIHQANQIPAKLLKEGDPAGLLLERWKTYSDHLMADFYKKQIPRQFRKAGLTPLGQDMLDALMTGPNGLAYEIDATLSTMGAKSPVDKMSRLEGLMGRVRDRLNINEVVSETGKRMKIYPETHPYFSAEGKTLQKRLAVLDEGLTYGKGMPRYLENYTARLNKQQRVAVSAWRDELFKDRAAFFTQARVLEKAKGEQITFGRMIEGRTMAQAKELYLYDALADTVEFSKSLPPAWRDYVEGYISGILGIPSGWDMRLAGWFTKTVGKVESGLGLGEGLWDEWRVLNLANSVNNLTYLGGLGFKPFSAMRNLFQPLLTVPADLGGLKDLGTLVSGARRAMNPETRSYLRSIGAIGEYAPEVHLRPRALPFGPKLWGKELPSMDRTRDLALWMFKGSDRWNRYVSGGAAMEKWDKVVARLGAINEGNVKQFTRDIRLAGRNAWKRVEIEDLLHRGRIDEAKAVFVNDVIADTQYLYGVADAPQILRKGGAITRTGFIFQSWWMNYGSLIGKWMTTGTGPGAKAERVLTAAMSGAIAHEIMEPIWGSRTATRTIGLGPFPSEFNEFMIPPAWTPVYHGLAAILNIQKPEVSAKHAKRVLGASTMFIPGGLQAKAFFKGAMEEGWPGFSKAIIRYKGSDED